MIPRVAVVDYGLCNLDSVCRAVERCGGAPFIAAQAGQLASADRVILPGVGAFGEAMGNLASAGMLDALNDVVSRRGRPFLGICLGMQLMARMGNEGQPTKGLDWIDADVVRLPSDPGARIPNVGWSEVVVTRPDPLLESVPQRSDFYFVHSFVLVPRNPAVVIAETPFGTSSFVSAVRCDNRWGVQFHPEKSQRLGFAVLTSFLRAAV